MTLTLFGVSMPIFWLGLMLLILFAAVLGWVPIGGLMPVGMEPPRVTGMSVVDSVLAGDPAMVWQAVHYLLLPAFTLATVPLALITRITRAEVMAAALLRPRAHGAREGADGAARHPAPCAAQRGDPDRDGHRTAARPAAVRRGADRDDLLAAGPRPADGRFASCRATTRWCRRARCSSPRCSCW